MTKVNLPNFGPGVEWVYNVRDAAYGAKGDGSTDDTSAINAAVSAWSAGGGKGFVYLPAGTYLISSTLNWKIEGLKVRGAGKYVTQIMQTGTNMPIVEVANFMQDIGELTLKFNTQRASTETLSTCLVFGDDSVGSCFDSYFHDLVLEYGATGMTINPSIAAVAGLFSCTLENIRILGYSIGAINLSGGNGSGGNCTGCVFNNIYTHNNSSGSDTTTCTSWPVYLANWDECTFNQLNIEHGTNTSNDQLAVLFCGTVTFNGLHFEDYTLNGNGSSLFYLHSSKVVVNGGTCRFNIFAGSGSNPIARFYSSGAQLMINGWTDNNNTVTTPSRPFLDWGSGTSNFAFINGMDAATQITVPWVNGDATSLAEFSGARFVSGLPVTLTDASTIALDASLGNTYRVTLGGNRTLGTPTNPSDGQTIVLEVKQDGTGSRTLTFGSVYKFGTDVTSVTLTTTAAATDEIILKYNATATKWRVLAVNHGF